MLRQRYKHNSPLNNQYQQKLPLKASSRSSREARALEERINMAELMAKAEYMEKKKSLEFENLGI